jgi:hypothetical protein
MLHVVELSSYLLSTAVVELNSYLLTTKMALGASTSAAAACRDGPRRSTAA